MSKTIIAVRHFGLGGRESLETAVSYSFLKGLPGKLFRYSQPIYRGIDSEYRVDKLQHFLNMQLTESSASK